jgi:RNA polymerase sigma-70 factor (ECF subfamily)
MLSLSGLAAALLESNALVDDVVQDVFLYVWEHRATLDVRTNVLGYLQRAVYNRVFNVLRHERSQQRKTGNAADLDTDFPRVARNDAEQRLEDEDLEVRLRAALAHVPPSPRRVFLLSWQAGLTYREIAGLLGMTTRSVTKQMYRATQTLAVHFRRDG